MISISKYSLLVAASLMLALSPLFASAAVTSQELQQLQTYTSMLKQGGGEYLQYGPAIDNDTSLLVSTAKARKALLEKIAVKNPSAFLNATLSAADRQRLPENVRPYLETESTKKGVVAVLHRDDFKRPQNSTFEHYLNSAGTTYRLVSPRELPVDRSGATITANVYSIGAVAVVKQDASDIAINTEPPPLESLGEQKTLVILIDYQDSGPRLFTASEIKQDLETADVGKLMREQSYAKTSIKADVVDWQRLNRNATINGRYVGPIADSPDGTQEMNSLYKIIKAQNIALENYSRIVYFDSANSACDGYAGWSGVGTVANSIWGRDYKFSLACVAVNAGSFGRLDESSLRFLDYVFSHEFGHSLGVMHANSFECADTPFLRLLGANCAHAEYGNWYDTMGGGSYAYHFNAFYKYLLGWLDTGTYADISSYGSKSVTLVPLENTTGQRAAMVRDPASGRILYSIEYRQPIGFDAKIASGDPSAAQGVLINRIMYRDTKNADYPFTQILRMGQSRWALRTGDVAFSDPSTGVSISLTSRDAQGATVKVTLSKTDCLKYPPSYASPWHSAPYDVQMQPGDGRGDFFIFTNENGIGCDPTTYSLTHNVPSEWSPVAYEMQPVVSKDPVYPGIFYTVPSGVTQGQYVFNFYPKGDGKKWPLLATTVVTVGTPSAVLGDVNGDFRVTSSDALLTLKTAVGTMVPGFIKSNAEVNCSYPVSAADALMILKFAVGSITSFPPCVSVGSTGSVGDLSLVKEGSGRIDPSYSGTAATTTVTLTGIPAAGYTFTGFSEEKGACSGKTCTLIMTDKSNYSVTATFTLTLQGAVFNALGMFNEMDSKILWSLVGAILLGGTAILFYTREGKSVTFKKILTSGD